MSKVTRRRNPAAKKRHRLIALRRRGGPAQRSVVRRERDAHQAWAAAKRLRKAAQDRVVCAFRKQIDGTGFGPADAELLMFARRAVAEQRSWRSLAQAKAQRCCRAARTLADPATVPRRGVHP